MSWRRTARLALLASSFDMSFYAACSVDAGDRASKRSACVQQTTCCWILLDESGSLTLLPCVRCALCVCVSLGLHKWWKAHEKINGQVIEHISPYQQKVVSTLFKHPLHAIKSKVLGDWPAIPAFGGMFYFMHWAKEKHHHNARAEWP